jgi:8-oxo-dGTP pyrophosphatase MutT (NUDIX family)
MDIELISRGVFIDKGHVLVVHRKGADNVFLPGGHIDKGETAPAALERELTEELDIPAVSDAFLGVVEHTYSNEQGDVQEINLVFRFASHGLSFPSVIESAESHLEFSWLPCRKQALKKANLQPWVLQEQIPLWAKGQPWTPYLSTITR